MEGMKILIVDDESSVIQNLRRELEITFAHSKFMVVSTEQDFRARFPEIKRFNPDIAVLDVFLPWTRPSPDMVPPPPDVTQEGFAMAGIRCLTMLRGGAETAAIPVILHTVLAEADVRRNRTISGLGETTFIVEKSKGIPHLLTFVRSLSEAALQRSEAIASVFLVHGHDDGSKETIARFLEHSRLRPIILHEQPNEGRHIFLKLEDYSHVNYAIVLATPDDVGAASKSQTELRPRARQNVILELGYFLGRLGKDKVCCLIKGGVEIPSDYHGILYVNMDDNGAWRMQLAREMRAAGVPIRSEGA